MSEWISIKDKLPTVCERVLVLLHNDVFYKQIEIAELVGTDWYFGDDLSNKYVSSFVKYWMPLPSPPEIKDE